MGDGGDTRTVDGRGRTSPAAPLTVAEALAPGEKLGRFEVVKKLGAGGAGVVYEAHDAVLGRNVALKLLHAADDPDWSQRMLREARAAASLPHPNVVTVYDVGGCAAGLYIAMELVDGKDARAYCNAAPRTWREIVAVYLQAGRGLAAAHRAGLVHRDVKPDNILVGRDGRARVADFGLARPPAVEPSGGDDAVSDERLTLTGAVLGTPRYMAPEQKRGVADARSDQYGFCVSFWEALTGEVPEPDPVPGRKAMPRHIARALARGLRADPARRWPDLDGLLDALARDPAVTWRRAGLAAAATAAVVAAVVVLGDRGGPDCGGGEVRYRAVWSPARREALRAAFIATGSAHAGTTFAKVAGVLDGHAGAWSAARADACEDTFVRGEQSQALLDLRMACLDRRLGEVDGLLGALNAGGTGELALALDAVTLATRDLCTDPSAVQPRVPPPADPELRARIDALGREIADLRGLFNLGRYLPALARVETRIAEVRATGHPPLIADGLMLLADLQGKAGKSKEAEATYREVTRAAASARDDEQVARAWSGLIAEIGEQQHRYADALALQTAAESAIARAGDPPLLAANLARTLGVIYQRTGKLDDARRVLERSVALHEGRGDPGSVELASSLLTLGVVETKTGAYADAGVAIQRAGAILIPHYGASHPATVPYHVNLANLYARYDRWAEATAEHERALTILRGAFGDSHPRVADAHFNLAIDYAARDDDERAVASYGEALALFRKLYGDDHPHVGRTLKELGWLELRRDRFPEALAHCRLARATMERSELRDVALVMALRCQGRAARLSGLLDEAIEAGERSVTVAAELKAPPAMLAGAKAWLAQSLWAARRDRARAIALAEEAVPDLRPLERPEVEADLASWRRR